MGSLPFEVTGTESEWTDLCYRSRKGKWCRAFPSRTASGIVVLTNQSAWYPHLLLPTVLRLYLSFEMIDIMRNNLYRLLKYISDQQKHSFLLYCEHRSCKSHLLHGVFINLHQQSERLTYDGNNTCCWADFLSTIKFVKFLLTTVIKMNDCSY